VGEVVVEPNLKKRKRAINVFGGGSSDEEEEAGAKRSDGRQANKDGVVVGDGKCRGWE